MRAPMEAMYGREGLQELWSSWVDSMKRYLSQRQGETHCFNTAFTCSSTDHPFIIPHNIPKLFFLLWSVTLPAYYLPQPLNMGRTRRDVQRCAQGNTEVMQLDP